MPIRRRIQESAQFAQSPAKTTDSRHAAYIKQYGAVSWELDALDPTTLANLITTNILQYRDGDTWDLSIERETADIARLEEMIG